MKHRWTGKQEWEASSWIDQRREELQHSGTGQKEVAARMGAELGFVVTVKQVRRLTRIHGVELRRPSAVRRPPRARTTGAGDDHLRAHVQELDDKVRLLGLRMATVEDYLGRVGEEFYDHLRRTANNRQPSGDGSSDAAE
jgi:hypothetical protein